MIFATAGHVDHGKTALLRALTGTDADRLPEEKRRGMTIDLGYAYLPLEDGRTLGFIDVPGHEKFLGNMLAGVGGVHHALLVVAADDGPMPQTREHLAILQGLGLPGLTVALTKADLVTAAGLAEAMAAIQRLTAGHGYPDAPLFAVSSLTGEGVPALRAHLANQADGWAAQQAQRRFRLAVDRVFSLSGAGLVVTGTAFGGRVAVDDTLFLTGADVPVRVRSLHAQNRPAQAGQAGERIALNLVGNVSREQIRRGDWLLSEAPPAPRTRVTVALDLLPGTGSPISHWQPVHLYHGARHVTGRIALLEGDIAHPGGHTLAELDLDTPLHLAERDRLLVRDGTARHTLAGASVLELTPPQRGKRRPARLTHLRTIAQAADDESALMALQAGQQALALTDFAWARQWPSAKAETLPGLGTLIRTGRGQEIWLSTPQRWQALADRVQARLAILHAEQPDQLGAGRARLRRLALPAEPESLAFALFDAMVGDGRLVNSRGWLHLPEHVLSFEASEARLWEKVAPHFTDRTDPWWVRDLAQAAGSDEDTLRALLRKAARLGHVVAVVPDRYYSRTRLQALAEAARVIALQDGFVEAAGYRSAIGAGRKLAIQVLEYFDRVGFTRRAGDRHYLRETALF